MIQVTQDTDTVSKYTKKFNKTGSNASSDLEDQKMAFDKSM